MVYGELRRSEPLSTPCIRLASEFGERIAVLRALQFGDMLCATPALRALRASCPQSRITLIGLPWARELADRLPYVDDSMHMPGVRGLPEQPVTAGQFERFAAAAHARRFTIAIQMHGDGHITNEVVARLGAGRTAGYRRAGDRPPDAATFIAYPDQLPEPRRHLALVANLGAPAVGEHLDFPLLPRDFDDLRRALNGAPRGRYAVVHAGGRSPLRRWDAASFAAVVDWLARDGLAVYLTGTADETVVTRTVCEYAASRPTVLAGKTTIGALAALLADADVLVANDTGVSHLAAALRVPSVIIGRNSDPVRWAPLDRALHRYLIDSPQAPVTPSDAIAQLGCVLGAGAARQAAG